MKCNFWHHHDSEFVFFEPGVRALGIGLSTLVIRSSALGLRLSALGSWLLALGFQLWCLGSGFGALWVWSLGFGVMCSGLVASVAALVVESIHRSTITHNFFGAELLGFAPMLHKF